MNFVTTCLKTEIKILEKHNLKLTKKNPTKKQKAQKNLNRIIATKLQALITKK